MRSVPVFLLLLLSLTLAPNGVSGQEWLVPCTGPDCNFCSAVQLVNNVIEFVIIVAIVIATIMLAVSGVQMVISRGNPGAWQKAKDHLINVCIGILLIMAAWMIVDTLMKLLISDDVTAEFGFWNDPKLSEDKCGLMNPVGEAKIGNIVVEQYDNAIVLGGDETGVAEGTTVSLYRSIGSGGGGGSGGSSGRVNSSVSASACDESVMTGTSLFGHSIQIHRSLVPSLQRIDQAWRAHGGNSEYRVYSVGGYSCRNVAGSNKKSYHAFGMAVDINPDTNPHQSTCRTDMPLWFRQLFLDEGWGWGCNWRSSKDAMHFSKAPSEGGDGSY